MAWHRSSTCWFCLLLTMIATARGADGDASTSTSRVEVRPAGAPEANQAVARRLMIVSIDGARPDLVLRADMPTVHALIPQSTFTFWARTIPHAITLPSHTSMLTGVIPRKHKIEWNEDLKLAEPVYPKFPTLLEVAHKAGLTTSMIAGKAKFGVLNKPATIDWAFLPRNEKGDDEEVAAHAVEAIRAHQPEVMFVHLPGVDNAGHQYGWSSAQQMKALAGADAALAKVLAALEEKHLRDKTILLVTADHGGAGMTHLPDDARARHIPWLISGPGIRKNFDLTINARTVVDTEDSFATACYLLGIPRGPDIDGKCILDVLEKPIELMRNE